MPENLIKFQKTRDFGEILNVTFAFLKENFQPLALTILIYNTPFTILAALIYGLSPLLTTDPNDLDTSSLLMVLIASFIYGTTLSLLIYQYIVLYIELGKQNFTPQDVWQAARGNLLPIMQISLVYTLLIGLGFVMVILPGIYWMITYAFIYIVRVVEKKNLFEGGKRCIALLKDPNGGIWNNWFKVLGLLIITVGISYIISTFLAIPLGLMGLDSEKLLVKSGGSYSFLLVIASLIDFTLDSFAQTIFIIALAFQYFSLVEERDSLDLRNQIETFGQNSA
jgi:hypothetical protein